MAPSDNLRTRMLVPCSCETELQRQRRQATEAISHKWDDHSDLYAVQGDVIIEGGPPTLNDVATTVLAPPVFQPLPLERRGFECYRNSVLQALFHIPKFSNWLKFYHQPTDVCQVIEGACLACRIRALLELYWVDGASADKVETRRVQNLRSFLRFLQINRPSNMEAWQPGQNQAYTLQSDAQEFFIKMTAWIDLNCWGFWEEVWYGLVRTTALSTRHCIYCKTPRVPHEETLYVQPCSIPANARHVRLTTLIHDYYSPLSSGNQIPDVVCESCKRKGAQITMVARVYPDILPVYIQRFGSTRTGRNIVTHKNRCRVDIPEILDLSRYLEGKVKKAAVFELMSTVQHMGDIETGHYKMFGRQPDNTWLACEDSCVTSAKFYQAVEKADEWDPYLLFYRRLPQSGRIRAMTTTAVAVAEQKDKKEKENKKKKTKEKEGKKEQGKKDKEMKDKKKRKASELPDGKTETPGKKQKSRKKVLV